ncbi:MAG TPA: DUF4157 domain-containing protein [Bryobacteraceae bacterium]|nr:DUF4157 domain-containing protein [Bryobacteraceae bacterium]
MRAARRYEGPAGEAKGHGRDARPAGVSEVLRSPGAPLESGVRSFFESRFGYDFGQVRVHADARAGASARELGAPAYTVGRHIAVAPEYCRPGDTVGRRLLAHELTHVMQQRDAAEEDTGASAPDRRDSPFEQEARRAGADVLASAQPARPQLRSAAALISRADPELVERTLNLRSIVGSGIQFLPAHITDTRVGPVTVSGGLLSDRASRLNVLVGQDLTLRVLARSILPLWTSATPFTPPGATAPLPLPPITEDELAQALLVYNRYYLQVPSMTKWQAGLRFPLPVEIDETTGVATLHPLQIQALASGFDPTWAPLLDTGAQATAAPAAGTLQTDVATFLTQEPTALARGIHLGARALTNAISALPFVREAFRQMGADALDAALNFMDFLVNRQIDILAAQRDGAAILAEIRSVLGTAPATPTTSQQERLARAIRMLDRVTGVTAEAPPEAFINPCDPIRPLTWADFRGTPGGGGFGALTRWNFPDVTGPSGRRLRAVFQPNQSWVRPQFANPTNGALNGCNTTVAQCEGFFSPGVTGTFSMTPSTGCPASVQPNPSVVATNFSGCSGALAPECTRVAVEESARLLRHEQLHFDIACILVGKANASLAAGRNFTTVRAALTARSNAVTSQYDTQTNHGCFATPQATWVTNVSAGLPGVNVP